MSPFSSPHSPNTGFDSIAAQHHASDTGFSRHYLTLYSLVMGMECQSVFEFGAGHSTKTILSALEASAGHLVSCDLRPVDDIDPLGFGFDHTYWDRWIFLQGNSRQIVNNLSCEFGPYDLVLHDGSHDPEEVIGDLRDIVPQMRRDSLLLVHDTAHPEIEYGLAGAVEEALADFAHSRVRLPFGYGLDVVRIEEDFGHPTKELTWRKQRPAAQSGGVEFGAADGAGLVLPG